jgi:hypothetical protein
MLMHVNNYNKHTPPLTTIIKKRCPILECILVGHPMVMIPTLLWVVVVSFSMLAWHANQSPSLTNKEFPTMVVGHMWTRQHGMEGLTHVLKWRWDIITSKFTSS